jgi:hypothetical protein
MATFFQKNQYIWIISCRHMCIFKLKLLQYKKTLCKSNLVDKVWIAYDHKPVDQLLSNEIQLYETMVQVHVLKSIIKHVFLYLKYLIKINYI